MEGKHTVLHRSDSKQSDDSRNFRCSYYEKVGFRGVEARKKLTQCFSEKPIDLNVLTNFTQRFTIPADFRLHVWKLLLGVTPNDVEDEIEKNVTIERISLCNYLKQSVNCLLLSLPINNLSEEKLFALMFLLENGHLTSQLYHELENNEIKHLTAIANIFQFEDATFEDKYWLFRNFCQRETNQRPLYVSMIEKVHLELDDKELEQHLASHSVNTVLVIWFSNLFSGFLHRDSLIKIIEKIIVNFHKILILTAKRILITLKSHLLSISTTDELHAKLLMPLTTDTSEHIVGKVLDQL